MIKGNGARRRRDKTSDVGREKGGKRESPPEQQKMNVPLLREHDGLGALAVRGPEEVAGALGLSLGRCVVRVKRARGVAVPLVESRGHLVDLLGVPAAHG